jgi:hypothetical protein
MHDWKRFFNSIPGNLEQSNYRIFEPNNPDGKAEIFHWFSRDDIPTVTKDEFIEALINFEISFDNNYENFYRYRAYFLAAEALSYFPKSCFGDEIVNQLLRWSYVYFSWEIVPSPLKKAAREALKKSDCNRVITAFTKLLHSTTSRVTLRHAAVELGKFDPGNRVAIAALVLLLDVTRDDYLRSNLCKSLGEIGNGDINAISVITSVLGKIYDFDERNFNPWNYSDADFAMDEIQALSKIGKDNPVAIAALEEFIQQSRGNDYVRFSAVRSLWNINPDNVFAKDTLVDILESSTQLSILREAREFLHAIDPLISTSNSMLSDRNPVSMESDGLLQHSALELLAIFSANPLDKERLRMILDVMCDCYRFEEIVTSIEQYSSTDEATINFLLTLLEITKSGFYLPNKGEGLIPEIAEALTKIDNYFELGVNNLIGIIGASDNKYRCQHALYSLGRVDFNSLKLTSKKHCEIVALLEHFLQVNWGDIICWGASETLLKIDQNNEIAFSTLLNILEFNREYWIRFRATEVLLKSSVNHKKVLKVLLELTNISDDDSYELLNHSLAQIGESHLHKESCTDYLISGYIRLIQCYEENRNTKFLDASFYLNYDENLLAVSKKIQQILTPEYFPIIIKSLKQYLNETSDKNTSYRYEAAYNLIWYCAQNMNYLDFYNTLTTQHC